MNDTPLELLSPEECTNRILELSGVAFEPDNRGDIRQHRSEGAAIVER